MFSLLFSLLCGLVFVFPGQFVFAQDATFTISGYVVDSNGNGVKGAQIIFNVPSIIPSVISDSSGYYEVFAPQGTYHINVWSPFDSSFVFYDEPDFVVESSVTKNISLESGYKVSGYISDFSGAPVADGIVVIGGFSSGWFSDFDGYYFVGVPAGTYNVTVKPRSGSAHFPDYFESNFVVNDDTEKNFTVNATSQVSAPSSPEDLVWNYHFSFPPDSKDTLLLKSTPAVVDGVVYVGTNSKINSFPHYINPPEDYILETWNNYYAFNASNGDLIWNHRDNSSWFISSECGAVDGIAYFSGSTAIVALNASNGELVWNYTAEGGDSSPFFSNGVVYLITTNDSSGKTLHAFNATTGNEIWNYPHLFGATGEPTIVNGVLYFGIGAVSDDLSAFNASTGEQIWTFTAEDIVLSTPAVSQGVVYFTADKNIYAVNASTGDKLWNYSTTVISREGPQYESRSPTVANGIVYVYSIREKNFYALKASNGEKLWNLTGASGNPPKVENGIVYVKYEGSLWVLNAYTGEKMWKYTNMSPSVTINEGVLYSCSGEYLYAVRAHVFESTHLSAKTLQALTDEGKTVNLEITGNVTSSQISSIYITKDQTTTGIYFTVTGESTTTGFSNITIQKCLIQNQSMPTIYIDDQTAEKQGYTQDPDNYYVWYTTNFSTHQISIIFRGGTPDYIPEFSAGFLLPVVLCGCLVVIGLKKKLH